MGIRDDELWEELRYWLTHPITDEEQKRRDAEEKAYQEKVLNRVFGLDKPKGVATGAAAPVATPTQTYWDKNGNLYYTDSNGNKLPPQISLENIAKRAKAIATNASSWINETNPESQAYKEKINAILTLETLPLGTSASLAKPVAQKLAPYVGRKIAQGVSQGLNSGAISGAFEGALRSYQEKENPLKTIPQDAALGAVLGAGTGVLSGKVEKVVRGNNLKSYGDIDALDKVSRKQYSQDAKKYYQDYIQETSVNKDGNIDFTKRGIQEQLRWNPKQGQNLPGLKNDLKSAKRLPDEPNRDALDKKDTDYFEVYRGKYGDHFIEHFKNDNRRYYITKDTPTSATHATSTDANGSANNIIPDVHSELKSWSEWLEELKRRRGHK